MDNVNVACVGVGYWGKNLVRTFYDLPGSCLRVCCDLNQELLEGTRHRYPGVATTSEFEEVLGDPGVDAVVLASPARTHYELARAALLAGKHTYVEKPITLDSAEAEELYRLASARGLILMVGHLMEYHPAVGHLKTLIDEGHLGDVRYLYFQRLNLGIIRKDENALWSLAPHDISIALYLTGTMPQAVSATGQAYLQTGVEDVVFCCLHFPGGQLAHIHVSWLDPNKVRRVTAVGSDRMAVFDDMEPNEKVRVYDKGVNGNGFSSHSEWMGIRSGDITIPRIDATEPLKMECEHFVASVVSGRPPRSDGNDGVRVVRVLEAAQMSLQQGGAPVALGETDVESHLPATVAER